MLPAAREGGMTQAHPGVPDARQVPAILGERARLFVDLHEVDAREGVRRVFHQAARHGSHPVLRQEAPWERHSGMTASVVYDDEAGIFKAWYLAGNYAPGVGHVQCLATSPDGIAWE